MDALADDATELLAFVEYRAHSLGRCKFGTHNHLELNAKVVQLLEDIVQLVNEVALALRASA